VETARAGAAVCIGEPGRAGPANHDVARPARAVSLDRTPACIAWLAAFSK
jgi:hypothetical protein